MLTSSAATKLIEKQRCQISMNDQRAMLYLQVVSVTYNTTYVTINNKQSTLK